MGAAQDAGVSPPLEAAEAMLLAGLQACPSLKGSETGDL
jgi:hypothetical protein